MSSDIPRRPRIVRLEPKRLRITITINGVAPVPGIPVSAEVHTDVGNGSIPKDVDIGGDEDMVPVKTTIPAEVHIDVPDVPENAHVIDHNVVAGVEIVADAPIPVNENKPSDDVVPGIPVIPEQPIPIEEISSGTTPEVPPEPAIKRSFWMIE